MCITKLQQTTKLVLSKLASLLKCLFVERVDIRGGMAQQPEMRARAHADACVERPASYSEYDSLEVSHKRSNSHETYSCFQWWLSLECCRFRGDLKTITRLFAKWGEANIARWGRGCAKICSHTFFKHKSFFLVSCPTHFGYTKFELLSTDTVDSGL